MHQQKKYKTFNLHDIPISRSGKLHYVSYSIPLGCACALLLVLGVAMSIPVLKYDSGFNADLFSMSDGRASALEVTGSKVNVDFNMQSDLVEGEPTGTSLSISGAGASAPVMVAPGSTGYREHVVEVRVVNARAYSLSIAGQTNLNTPSVANIAITGANGKTGEEMLENTWGYSWGDTDADVDNIPNNTKTYDTVLPIGTALNGAELSADGNANFSRKLVFAAKFSPKVAVGNYTSAVTLSLAVTPEEVGAYWYNQYNEQTAVPAYTSTMQGIGEGFCKDNDNVDEGWTVRLKDIRETNKYYTVVKLKDNNCWMQENLTLPPETNVANMDGSNKLTDADTDNPWEGLWLLSGAAWENTNTEARMVVGDTNLTKWQEGYGNYYNWCAATAGTCSTATTDGSTATGSICPKNWRLPTGGGSGKTGAGQFGALLNDLTIPAILAAPYDYLLAGEVINTTGELSGAGSTARYWSSTSFEGSGAFRLYVYNTSFYPGSDRDYNSYYGLSIRCIASY